MHLTNNEEASDKRTNALRLKNALIAAAVTHGVWFDTTDGRTKIMISGAPMTIPSLRVNGMPPKMKPEVEHALAAFKEAVIQHLVSTMKPVT